MAFELAKKGCRFYVVITPSFFREIELPENGEWSDAERQLYEDLKADAEAHGTSIFTSLYRLG